MLEVSSFLDAEAIVNAAKKWGAELLHPGYGFLSENAEFARQVESNRMRFVGPTPESMERLGNKESAKKIAEANGVPTLASVRFDEIDDIDDMADKGIEPPYLVKAAGGFVYGIIDQLAVDGFFNGLSAATDGAGSVVRKLQTGRVQQYAAGVVAGALILVLLFVFVI